MPSLASAATAGQSGSSSAAGSAATSPISPAFASPNYTKENGSMTTVGDEVWSDAQETAEIEDDAVRTRREIEEIDGAGVDGRGVQATARVPSVTEAKEYSEDLKVEDKKRAESIVIERPPSGMTRPDGSRRQNDVAVAGPPGTASVNSAPSSASGRTTMDSFQTLEVPASASVTNPSPALSHHSATSLERQSSRRRSTVDSRAANRFSGFLSQLIHRRPERELPTSASQPSVVPEENSRPRTEDTSRASSPSPPTRPITPPPTLPPPALPELGLSLTAITSVLTPSHFSTPPTSGTFLAPHFLLLCHTQGLDVLPLVSPPAPQPYALVRRVSFKNVVVMEERGVLVAIAGRRDGVRVYALEEVRKAVEWRIDVEVRRERERMRREEAKKGIAGGVDRVFGELKLSKVDNDKYVKARLVDSPTTPTPPTPTPKSKRRKSVSASAEASTPSPRERPRPRPPTIRRKSRAVSREADTPPQHDSDPPPYRNPSPTRPPLRNQTSVISVAQTRSRTGSIADVLAGTTVRRRSAITTYRDDEKADWEHGSSDDEAINMTTAGSSGSAALDERTSAMVVTGSNSSGTVPSSSSGGLSTSPTIEVPSIEDSLRRAHTSTSAAPTLNRRGRPAQLDLTNSSNTAVRPPPSPTPTVWTLRQALTHAPPGEERPNTATSDADNDEDEEEEGGDSITFAQALLESRLPDLPPLGTRQPQEPILIGSHSNSMDEPQSPRDTNSEIHSTRSDVHTPTPSTSRRSRRRWSVFDGVFTNSNSYGSIESSSINSRPNTPSTVARPMTADSQMTERSASTHLTRISSADATSLMPRPSSARGPTPTRPPSRASTAHTAPTSGPAIPRSVSASGSAHHRFLPRILTNAFSSRRSEEQLNALKSSHSDLSKRQTSSSLPPVPPAPKLEYVKLPGTKGAILIKAVETAKKSFLAILCGENGEKVELFAGTYRTTLGLSRTFILPDSPRSLELQLQGDDLVEVFLVFAQNVFGLEPATVRVREVRVGRSERRAARRRARDRVEELVSQEADAPTLGDDDANGGNNGPVGVTFSTTAATVAGEELTATPPIMSRHTSESNIQPNTPGLTQTSNAPDAHSDELTTIAAAQLAPYSTFQQLNFAPSFPLATIADECIIPPTYQSFLEYRAQYEPEENGVNNLDLANVQFTPPGLPVPPVLPPSKWYYRDPKGVVHGPWKASLMQTWYKDGLLPPDLPVRREEDSDFILLKDLRAQSVDPTHPFRSLPPPLDCVATMNENVRPLLEPISLLTQPRHYGPPALFFTTRGGHSTSIVDSRGRSVLKGRIQWSSDEEENFSFYGGRLGDVKRLEAFDVQNKAVIVAVRQGGLEVIEVGDALMRPGDLSRTYLPHFQPSPSTTNRREPFVWRVGSPLSHFASGPISSAPPSLPQTPSKKQNLGNGKSPAKSDFALGVSDDFDSRSHEELLCLGRNDDNVYFCERSNGSFRILRLCPNPVS